MPQAQGDGVRKTIDEDVQKILDDELERLKRKSGFNLNVEVRWIPNGSVEKSGEVKGNTIYIYEEDREEALKTLRHEFLELLLARYSSMHKKVINKLLEVIEELFYLEKERTIRAILNLIE